MAFLVFIGFLYLPLAFESFLLRPDRVSKRCSFGGGSVRFFFSESFYFALAEKINVYNLQVSSFEGEELQPA